MPPDHSGCPLAGDPAAAPRTPPTDRKTFIQRALAALAATSPAAAILAACGGDSDQSERGRGMGPDRMPGWMMSEGRMDAQMRRDMRVIRQLLADHRHIDRTVEDVPGGVRTTTVSDRPQLAQLIGTHVRQMKSRVEQGRPIRRMDPLFREIFEHHTDIHMEAQDAPGGIRVIETSDDPQVVLLIRQHARRAVSEFVEDGMRRAMRPTPLPPGYEA